MSVSDVYHWLGGGGEEAFEVENGAAVGLLGVRGGNELVVLLLELRRLGRGLI